MSILLQKLSNKGDRAHTLTELKEAITVYKDDNDIQYGQTVAGTKCTEVNGTIVHYMPSDNISEVGTEVMTLIVGTPAKELYIPCFETDNEHYYDKILSSLVAFECTQNGASDLDYEDYADVDINFLSEVWGFSKEDASERVFKVMMSVLAGMDIVDEDEEDEE